MPDFKSINPFRVLGFTKNAAEFDKEADNKTSPAPTQDSSTASKKGVTHSGGGLNSGEGLKMVEKPLGLKTQEGAFATSEITVEEQISNLKNKRSVVTEEIKRQEETLVRTENAAAGKTVDASATQEGVEFEREKLQDLKLKLNSINKQIYFLEKALM